MKPSGDRVTCVSPRLIVAAALASTLAFAPGMVLAAGKHAHKHRAELGVEHMHAQPKITPAKANAVGVRGSNRGAISLAPLPVFIYLQPKEKPTVAFTTPCIMIEKMSNGFPPFLAFEMSMFQVVGSVNELNVLPIRLEPVCV